MSKKIVIKMRSYKKLIGQDLLHLALLITMLKVDPDSLGIRQRNGYDTGGGVLFDQAWQHPSLSLPFIPMKGSTELIERYQEEIIEDLNTLGQFNRFSLLGNVPVQLSAYLVEADQCVAQDDNDLDNHTDTDSGISDIENIGSPFSQNSGGQSPDHSPQSPCPSSTTEESIFHHNNDNIENQISSVDKFGVDLNRFDDTADLMEFEEVIRDVASRAGEYSTDGYAVGSNSESAASAGIQQFQDIYDSDLMFEEEDLATAQEVDYAAPEYGPQMIPSELAGTGISDLEDHGALQYELMHMDEQLMNLDYNIEDLDEAFLKMDEEIAKTISEDDLVAEEQNQEIINNFDDIFDTDNVPRNSWDSRHQVFSNIPELLELAAVLPVGSSQQLGAVEQSPGEELLNQEADPDFDISSLDKLEAMDESLEEFDLGLLDSRNVMDPLDSRNILEPLDSEDILRNDVLFSNTLSSANSVKRFEDSMHTQVFTPETFLRPKSEEDNIKEESLNTSVEEDALNSSVDEETMNISVDDALLQLDFMDNQNVIKEEIKEEIPEIIGIKEEPLDDEEEEITVVKEIVRDNKKKDKKRKAAADKKSSTVEVIDQNDLIAKVMKESGLEGLDLENLDEIPEPEKVKTEPIKDEGVSVDEDEEEEEILHEELLDVVDAAQFEQTLQGAVGQNSVYSVQRKGFDSFSLSYGPSFNWHGYQNDHGYTDLKLEPGLVDDGEGVVVLDGDNTSGGVVSRRSRIESESSGYCSEDYRSSRDEKLAEKMGLPYTVYEIINCPVERFNKILNDKDLRPEQAKLCKDIRRRGKNKVAAQNCRKRKMETIEELQVQVESVRRRKEQLMRQREELEAERRRWSSKLEKIEQFVLGGMGRSVVEYTLQVVDDRVEVSTRVQPGSFTSRSTRSRQ